MNNEVKRGSWGQDLSKRIPDRSLPEKLLDKFRFSALFEGLKVTDKILCLWCDHVFTTGGRTNFEGCPNCGLKRVEAEEAER